MALPVLKGNQIHLSVFILTSMNIDISPSSSCLFLTLMTSAGNEENLRELVDPLLPYIDGIIAVVHRPCGGDNGLVYLEEHKGAGKIIVRDWVQRHDFSQNETLYAGVIQEGDLFIITDTLERPAAQFISRCKGDLNTFMIEHDLDCLVYYGKPFIVRYNEAMHYQGSPHWGLRGIRSAVELSHMYPDEGKVRLNVRPFKRPDPLGWVEHYVKYWLYPPGSNHAALGIEKWGGDLNQAFAKREGQRLAFRAEMRKRGVPLTVEGLKVLLMGPLDEALKGHLRVEKTLSDAYWFWRGRGAELKDTHKPSDALPIP